MICLGQYQFDNLLALAPMAGVTDRPFRQLCRQLGADWTPSEMVTSQPQLRNTRKSQLRLNHDGEPGPIIVQIAGAEAKMMAEAARFNVEHGAQIIDINMGCPAKKVCNVAAGSALLNNEKLVAEILSAVVEAVDVPITLKTRTGTEPSKRNIMSVAKIAEDCGIQLLSLHGRTRKDMYKGAAEYDTIAAVKQTIRIPVLANGDIDCPEKAATVLNHTQADGLMIGRAAQGNPWIFREVKHYLTTGNKLAPPTQEEIQRTLLGHLDNLYEFYGEFMGPRIARKHIGWYMKGQVNFKSFKNTLFSIEDANEQRAAIEDFFSQVTHKEQVA